MWSHEDLPTSPTLSDRSPVPSELFRYLVEQDPNTLSHSMAFVSEFDARENVPHPE
jgi:hypothetical protein